MPWKKANKDLINLLEKMMLNYRCDRRVMFAGVHEDTIIIRLAELDLKEIFNRFKDVKPFTPMGNHIMKEYAAVPESFVEKPVVLKQWLDKSYKYASSLPHKAAKRSSKKQ